MRSTTSSTLLLFVATLTACSHKADPPRDAGPVSPPPSSAVAPGPSVAPSATASLSASAPPLRGCKGKPRSTEMAPGLLVERVFASEESPVKGGDQCITLVRVDPARYRFVLLTAKAHGGDKPVTEWLRQHKLTGVINASMYGTDRRSVGLMIDGPVVNNGHDSEKFGGFFGFWTGQTGLPTSRVLGPLVPGVRSVGPPRAVQDGDSELSPPRL